jgi:ABC-type molybdate transport system ATPase subunit
MKFKLSHTIKRSSKQEIRFALEEQYAIDSKILGIFGQSGTGKSTLLKVLAGLIPSADYSLQVHGQDYENIPGASNPCVYVGSDAVLFDHVRVRENLTLVIKHSASSQKSQIDMLQVVALCGIEHLLNQPILALSSGEKQRVAFARALLCGKPIILLDEAFSALDWSARLYFIGLLSKLKADYSFGFVLVSHSLKELALTCDDIWVLQEGKFVLQSVLDDALDKVLISSTQRGDKAEGRQENLPINGQTLFSVLNLKYRGVDPLDEQLEIWELPGDGKHAAQQVIKRNQNRDASSISLTHDVIAHVIDADKISLTHEQHLASSMLNRVLVIVTSIDEADSYRADYPKGVVVTMSANGQVMRSLISKRSYTTMQIKVGDSLFAIFKAL